MALQDQPPPPDHLKNHLISQLLSWHYQFSCQFAITKIFTLCKHWMVTIQSSVLYVQWISVYSYLVSSVIVHQLFYFHSFCFAFVWFALFDYSMLHYLYIQCIFCPDTGNVFQVFWSPQQQPSGKSINIIHQTAPSFVLVWEVRAYYHQRHYCSEIYGTNLSI